MRRAPIAALAVALALAPAGAQSPAGRIALAPCETDGAAARCGTLTVFENRAARTATTS